jgi:hypothetical protein
MQEEDTPMLSERLLRGLFSNECGVRLACLEALEHVSEVPKGPFDFLVWTSQFDDDESIAVAASRLWGIHRQSQIDYIFIKQITDMIEHRNEHIRSNAGRGICEFLKLYPEQVSQINSLYTKYTLLRNPVAV